MEEYDYIRSNLLNTEASRKLKLWIGGARVAGSIAAQVLAQATAE